MRGSVAGHFTNAIDAKIQKGAAKMGQAKFQELNHAVPGNERGGVGDMPPALGWSDKLAGD